MTTHRATLSGPGHVTIAKRAICGGSLALIPAGDAPLCAACARIQRRRETIRGAA